MNIPEGEPASQGSMPGRSIVRTAWPWLVVAGLATLAVFLLFSNIKEEVDTEFPHVDRFAFSAYSPAVYRLAEPGDTLDRVGLYLSALGIVVAGRGGWLTRSPLWVAALGMLVGMAWIASTPWPTFDGWPGWNPREALNPQAPPVQRAAVALAAAALLAFLVRPLVTSPAALGACLGRSPALATVVAACLLFRVLEWPAIEPVGYWPRWGWIAGLILLDVELVRRRPRPDRRASWPKRLLGVGLRLGAVAALITLGLAAIQFHRPLNRLKVIEPGKLYISAMPTYEGLERAQRRHGFRTIINLFSETGPQRSPLIGEELRFIRERGLTYIERPAGLNMGAAGDLEFLQATLDLARDPAAQPVLVHCHGCMDRTPAWTGLYRFVDQGWSLAEVMTEIERHRGMLPKGSVYHLYNWVLPRLAPERYAADPSAERLRAATARSADPYQPRARSRPETQARRSVPTRF